MEVKLLWTLLFDSYHSILVYIYFYVFIIASTVPTLLHCTVRIMWGLSTLLAGNTAFWLRVGHGDMQEINVFELIIIFVKNILHVSE